MKLQHIKKQLLTVALTTVAMGAMAQSLNSAYYTEDYKFRHDLNHSSSGQCECKHTW